MTSIRSFPRPAAGNSDLEQRMRDEIAFLGRLCERALTLAEHEKARQRFSRAAQYRRHADNYSSAAFDMAMLLPLRGRA